MPGRSSTGRWASATPWPDTSSEGIKLLVEPFLTAKGQRVLTRMRGAPAFLRRAVGIEARPQRGSVRRQTSRRTGGQKRGENERPGTEHDFAVHRRRRRHGDAVPPAGQRHQRGMGGTAERGARRGRRPTNRSACCGSAAAKRVFCAGADLALMRSIFDSDDGPRAHDRADATHAGGVRAPGGAAQGDAGRDRRCGDGRRLRTGAGLRSAHRRRKRRASACPRRGSACCRPPAARSA